MNVPTDQVDATPANVPTDQVDATLANVPTVVTIPTVTTDPAEPAVVRPAKLKLTKN